MIFGRKIAGVCTCLCLVAGIGGDRNAIAEGTAGTPPAVLQPRDRQHLLHDRFAEYRTVDRVPAAVKAEMARGGAMADDEAYHRGERIFHMADPGKPYQAGDVIFDRKLPLPRLIFMALSPGYCVIEYETGGRGHLERTALYRLAGRSAQCVWKRNEGHTITELASLRTAIAKGQI